MAAGQLAATSTLRASERHCDAAADEQSTSLDQRRSAAAVR